MKKDKKIKYDLQRISTEQFAILDENYSTSSKVNMWAGLEFAFDDEDEVMGTFAEFIFSQNDQPFLKIKVGCHFELEPKTWEQFINKEQTKLTFPKAFMSHMAAITVGVARGILSAKTEGTQFNNFIIPLIDTNDMIDEDATFEKK